MPLAIAPDARRAPALTTPETCLYEPVVAEAADLEAAGLALARHVGPALQIDAIDPAWRAGFQAGDVSTITLDTGLATLLPG